MSTDLHTLSGAYALNALSAEEAEQFRQHLEACPFLGTAAAVPRTEDLGIDAAVDHLDAVSVMPAVIAAVRANLFMSRPPLHSPTPVAE